MPHPLILETAHASIWACDKYDCLFTYDLSLWLLPCWYCETIVTSHYDGLPDRQELQLLLFHVVSTNFLYGIVLHARDAQPRVALL